MKKKEILETALKDLAVVMTMHQYESIEFAYVAYALWKLSEGRVNVGLSNANKAKAMCYLIHKQKK